MLDFRIAKEYDVKSAASIEFQSIKFEPREFPMNTSQSGFEEIWADRIANRHFVTIIASIRGEDCGLISVVIRGKEGFIQALYVHPDFFRRKIATNLIRKTEYILREKGFRRLCLNVERKNSAAISLYESMDFTEDKVQFKNYLMRMHKDLN